MKRKLILCSVGTSVARHCPSIGPLTRTASNWDTPVNSFEKDLYALQRPFKEDEFRALSAETNCLDRIGTGADDCVVLLSSDSAPGRLCSEALHQLITRQYGIKPEEVHIRRIEGLQVHDGIRLRETGLKNLITTVLAYLKNPVYNRDYEIIFNPTGGFKGVLPFLTVLGMLHGKKTVYIFEHSNDLITLPPLPFTINPDLLNRARPAIQHLQCMGSVQTDEYFTRIEGYEASERALFLAFTEQTGENRLSLSPLVYCLLASEADTSQA